MKSVETLLHNINRVILNPLIGLLFAIALIVFLYGVFQYLLSGGSETARKTGASHILWGLVGLMIMVSAFGILNLLLGTFGISNPVSKEMIP